MGEWTWQMGASTYRLIRRTKTVIISKVLDVANRHRRHPIALVKEYQHRRRR
jgi:hypothetical protein